MSDDAQSSAEAAEILAITRDLCQRLDIKWIPDQVSWAEVYLSGDAFMPRSSPFYKDVEVGHPVMFMDTLFVAPSMKARLQPEEWGPRLDISTVINNPDSNAATVPMIPRLTRMRPVSTVFFFG